MQTRWQITLLYWCFASIQVNWSEAAGAKLVLQDMLFAHDEKQENATVPSIPSNKQTVKEKTPTGGLRVKQNAKKSSSKASKSGKKSGKKGKKGGPVRTVTIESFLVGLMVKDLRERPPLNDVIDLIDLTEEFYEEAFLNNVLFQDSFRSLDLTFDDDYTYNQAHGSFNYLLNLTARVHFEKAGFRKGFNDKIMPFMEENVDLKEYVEDYVHEIDTFDSTVSATIIIPSDPVTPTQQVPVPVPAPTPAGPPVTSPVTPPVAEPLPTATMLPTSTMMPTSERFDITLDLSEVPEAMRDVFTAAAGRWSQVVVGDLEPVEGTTTSSCGNLVPAEIDDLFICATVEEIDGVDGVLGSAGPEFARFTPTTIPYVGAMRFDLADIEDLKADGSLSGVILHEMGHVLGLGTLWTLNNLQTSAEAGSAKPPCPYSAETKASAEYQALSGCAGAAVPTESDGGPGTECGHWDEACLLDELMTGFSTGSLPLSRITVASLEDMGYVVDYDAADAYTTDDLDPSCVCSSGLKEEVDEKSEFPEQKLPGTTSNVQKLGSGIFALSTLFSSPSEEPVESLQRGSSENSEDAVMIRSSPVYQSLMSNTTKLTTRGNRNRKLSEEGKLFAMEYGQKLLRQNKELKARLPPKDAARYVGDLAVIILYREHGQIYSVEIQAH